MSSYPDYNFTTGYLNLIRPSKVFQITLDDTGKSMLSNTNNQIDIDKDLQIGGNCNIVGTHNCYNYQVMKYPTGFEDRSESTISYNVATRTLTITPTGTYFHIWINGTRYQYTTTSTTHDVAQAGYMFYFTTSGLTNVDYNSLVDWDDKVFCAIIYYYDTTYYLVGDERHTIRLDPMTHFILHHKIGCFLTKDPELTGYQLAPASPSNTSNQYSISTAVLWDEDLRHDLPSIAAGSYRYNEFVDPITTNLWIFPTSTQPYKWNSVTGYIQYQSVVGSNWTWQDVPNNNYINYYVITAPGEEANKLYQNTGAQQYYANLADAIDVSYIVDLSSAYSSSYNPPEFIILYKITFRVLSSYSNNGKCRIENIIKLNIGSITYF